MRARTPAARGMLGCIGSGRRNRSLAAACILASVFTTPLAAQVAPGPFAHFGGSWSGDGTIKLAGGTSERIRCRATYEVEEDGNRLTQDLTCASDSYKLVVTSEVAYKKDAGVITGRWLETTYDTGGFLSGRITADEVKAQVKGRSFYADVAMTTKGDEQSVTIRPKDLDVQEVSVKLMRRPG